MEVEQKGLKHITNAVKQKIHYFDIVRLYPTVNALDEYAVGFSKYVNNLNIADIESGKFINKN